VSTGAVAFEVGARSVHKEAWPLLHYGADDASLFHGVTNTVHQYSRADGFKGETHCSTTPAAGDHTVARAGQFTAV
jgi:hypothetical protein